MQNTFGLDFICAWNILVCAMAEKYGIFYMKTGAGHYSGAKSIYEKIKSLEPSTSCQMCDGLEGAHPLTKLWLETGYSYTSNNIPSFYLLFYHFTWFHISQTFMLKILSPQISSLLRHKVRREKFTKIISTHEILTPILARVCRELRLDIPIIQIVMDPFTAHPIWFYEKNVHYVVLSSYLKKLALQKYKIAAERVFAASPIFSEKFNGCLSEDRRLELRAELNIPQDKKVVLIAGGGEGLRNAKKIIKYFLKCKPDVYVMVVCGKNKELYDKLNALVNKANAGSWVKVFGFVNIMYELIQVADCVITKGGPATVMEIVASKTPLVISTFVRYQEWGNVFFVRQKNCGVYLKHPSDVYRKSLDIAQTKYASTCEVQNGLENIARHIISV